MNNLEESKEFGWDDEIEEDGYVLLEPGDYDFEVMNFEKTRSKNGNRMVVLDLLVRGDVKKNLVKDWLVLTNKAQWKIANFYTSIGMRKRGEKVKLDLENIIGKTGRCEIDKQTYYSEKDDKEYNNNIVRNYLEPVDDFEW